MRLGFGFMPGARVRASGVAGGTGVAAPPAGAIRNDQGGHVRNVSNGYILRSAS